MCIWNAQSETITARNTNCSYFPVLLLIKRAETRLIADTIICAYVEVNLIFAFCCDQELVQFHTTLLAST